MSQLSRRSQWRDAIKASGLKRTTKHAALVIADWWPKDDLVIWIEVSQLADDMGASKRTAQYALRELEAGGWLVVVEKARQHRCTRYALAIPKGAAVAPLAAPGPPPRTVIRIGRRAPISDEIRQQVYERDGRSCLDCGSVADLTLDHIFPWSLGGPDDPANLRTLCRSCNARKGDRLPAGTP